MRGRHREAHNAWRLKTTTAWSSVVGDETPDTIMEWKATSDYHVKQGRSTGHVSIRGGVLSVYLKRHWRLPLISRLGAFLNPQGCWTPAAVEWGNLNWARSVGISVPEPLALGECVGPGLQLRSFLAIRELTGMMALHQAIPLAQSLMGRTQFTGWKRVLLTNIANVVRQLHSLHRYHKDLYLCHFYVARPQAQTMHPGPLTLIDLHRLGHHRWGAWRWLVKDLAQLYFSTWGVAGINNDDRLMLFQNYQGADTWTTRQQMLYQGVIFKAKRYARHNGINIDDAHEDQSSIKSGLAA